MVVSLYLILQSDSNGGAGGGGYGGKGGNGGGSNQLRKGGNTYGNLQFPFHTGSVGGYFSGIPNIYSR